MKAWGALDLIDGVGTVALELSFVGHLVVFLQQRQKCDATLCKLRGAYCDEGVATRSGARNLPPPARPCLHNHPQPRHAVALQSAARAQQREQSSSSRNFRRLCQCSTLHGDRAPGAPFRGPCSCERHIFERRLRPWSSRGCGQGSSGGAVPATPPNQRWPHLQPASGSFNNYFSGC